MKVAHLVPTLHSDGPEIGLVDLAAVAREADIEMLVMALHTSADNAQVTALRQAGVPVAELGMFPLDPRAVMRVAKLMRDQRVELVHTTGVICVELVRKLQDAGARFTEVGVHHYRRIFGKAE